MKTITTFIKQYLSSGIRGIKLNESPETYLNIKDVMSAMGRDHNQDRANMRDFIVELYGQENLFYSDGERVKSFDPLFDTNIGRGWELYGLAKGCHSCMLRFEPSARKGKEVRETWLNLHRFVGNLIEQHNRKYDMDVFEEISKQSSIELSNDLHDAGLDGKISRSQGQINIIVSELFNVDGKALKKANMTPEMLEVRNKVEETYKMALLRSESCSKAYNLARFMHGLQPKKYIGI